MAFVASPESVRAGATVAAVGNPQHYNLRIAFGDIANWRCINRLPFGHFASLLLGGGDRTGRHFGKKSHIRILPLGSPVKVSVTT